MAHIMIVFVMLANGPGSFTPPMQFVSEPACQSWADSLDLEIVRTLTGKPEIRHFEPRCLGFRRPKPEVDA